MTAVGIIPNPASGKDIRRVVTHALVMGNRDKVNLVRRMLIGLHAAGVTDIRIMPDRFGIGEQAIANLGQDNQAIAASVSMLDMPVTGTEQDTIRAARHLQDGGVSSIITLGGDGTARLVGANCGEVPMLPVSTGTNNVLPRFIEGTIAGLCAGYFAKLDQNERMQVCQRIKRLDISLNGQIVDAAFVDVAAVEGGFVGSKAVWDPESIRQIFVAQASPTSIGLSAVVGMLHPVGQHERFGAVLELSRNGGGPSVVAPIAPGLVPSIAYQDITVLQPGECYPVTSIRPLVLALDGEREHVLQGGEEAAVCLTMEGPWVIDVDAAMRRAVDAAFFTRK